MTTTQMPPTIQANVHQDAISRVSGFFNASTREILNELLQNARRSRATRVDITLKDQQITVADDGEGISNAQAILSFGQSGWDSRKAGNEHPAGMGFYSLARREEVVIRSRYKDQPTWEVTLTPDHFVGKLPAPVVQIPEGQENSGTTITFTKNLKTEFWLDQQIVVQDVSKHYPLPVYLNEKRVEQEDFLKDATYTEEWEGIRIGVYQGANPRNMNFHGIVVIEPKLATVRSIGSVWNAQADVVDCPHLELTLPARREVVENPFMDRLRTTCKGAIYRAMSMQPEPVDVPKAAQVEALEMGVILPDASRKLQPWKPREAQDNNFRRNHLPREELRDDAIIMDLYISAADQQALARAIHLNNITERFMEPDSDLRGYTWYDQTTRATQLTISVTDQEFQHDLERSRTLEIRLPNQRPEEITFAVQTTDQDGKHQEIPLPTDLALENSEEEYPDENRPLVTQNSRIAVQELVDLMTRAYFTPSDDKDADSCETQQAERETQYERTSVMLLSSKNDVLRELLSRAAEKHLLHELPEGLTVTLQMKRGGPCTVTIEEPDDRTTRRKKTRAQRSNRRDFRKK